MNLEHVKNELYDLIRSQLAPELTYHSIHHTQDVHNVCKFYIDHYKINGREAELLEIAAVGHDVGFIKTYANHEQAGAEITSEIMKRYGYSKGDIAIVTELILATKIPQSPKSFLAQIICDADLDYLGRDDFRSIGARLKEEWRNYELVPNLDADFDNIQIGFLKSHFYHTDYAAENRGPVKLKHLSELENEQKKKALISTTQ